MNTLVGAQFIAPYGANMKASFGKRQSLRLRNYDYALPGAYFFTICTYDRSPLFGQINDSHVVLNEMGNIVAQTWPELSARFQNLRLDEFVVMPDHIHGIVQKGAINLAPTLGGIIRTFKALCTYRIHRAIKNAPAKIWQRNYHERVIRDESELNRFREYIRNNPEQWTLDQSVARETYPKETIKT